MNEIHPYSWSGFPLEFGIYFEFMGILHLALFSVGCLIFAVLAIRQRGKFLGRVGHLALFLGLLLVIGSVANGLWSCSVWGRLYYSTDYVFDFSAFWPITQGLIDETFGDMRGQLFGVSLFQLQIVWLLFATGTWAATILLYRLVCRRPPANKGAAANQRERSPLDGSGNAIVLLCSAGAVPAVAELGR
jgi:hypothetical protein